MAPKRGVFMVGRMLDQRDGLGVYGYNLFRHLLAMDPETRYTIALATPQHLSSFSEFPNASVLLLPGSNKLWWDQVTVPRAARRAGADLLFNPKFSVPLLSRIPSVMVLRSSDWYVNPSNYEWWDNLYIRLLLPVYCRKARGLLAVSELTRDDLARYAGVDSGKVSVSYSAPADYFRSTLDSSWVQQVSAQLELPNEYILSTGRVYHTGFNSNLRYPGANLEALIAAYRRYRSSGGSLPLVLAGRNLDEYLQRKGYAAGDLAGIRFLGFVPHREMPVLFHRAEFFVLTTLYESFSLPLVEAMASGCPVIGPATGAVPEVAGGAALLVDPRDPVAIASAMTALADSGLLRQRHREAGIRRAGDFSWRKTAERTLAVFDAVLKAGRC